MKRQLVSILLLASCFGALGAKINDEMRALQKEIESKVKIGTVYEKTISDSNDNETEQVSFHTYLTRKDDTKFSLRITIELTDKRGRGDVYFATLTVPHSTIDERTNPTGEESWEFEIPHGKLENPKITAYAIQSGIQRNGKFLPVFQELDGVDSAEEITGRKNTQSIDIECTQHTIWVKRLP